MRKIEFRRDERILDTDFWLLGSFKGDYIGQI